MRENGIGMAVMPVRQASWGLSHTLHEFSFRLYPPPLPVACIAFTTEEILDSALCIRFLCLPTRNSLLSLSAPAH